MVLHGSQIIGTARVPNHPDILQHHSHGKACILLHARHGLLFHVDALVGNEHADCTAEQQQAYDHGDHYLDQGKAALFF